MAATLSLGFRVKLCKGKTGLASKPLRHLGFEALQHALTGGVECLTARGLRAEGFELRLRFKGNP